MSVSAVDEVQFVAVHQDDPLAAPLIDELAGEYVERYGGLRDRVHAWLRGYPAAEFEPPAEIRMAGTIGGDLVGMSTVLEATAARQAALEVLGLSLATNLAAGISDVPLDGAHVLAEGERAAARVGARPAVPTIAAIPHSASRSAASINPDWPAATAIPLPDSALFSAS